MQILSSTPEELLVTNCFSHTELFRSIRTWLTETVNPHLSKKWATGETKRDEAIGEIQLSHLVVYVAGPLVLPQPIGRVELGSPVEATLEVTGRMIWLITGNMYEDQRRLELPIDSLPTTIFAVRWDDRISEQLGIAPIYPEFPESDVQQIIAHAAAEDQMRAAPQAVPQPQTDAAA